MSLLKALALDFNINTNFSSKFSQYSISLVSKYSPPKCVLPFAAFSSNKPSSTESNEKSKVPIPNPQSQ